MKLYTLWCAKSQRRRPSPVFPVPALCATQGQRLRAPAVVSLQE